MDVFQKYTPRSGIEYAPLLEWIMAARWGGYTLEQFDELDGQRQAVIVAAFRCEKQIDAVLAWENRPKGS